MSTPHLPDYRSVKRYYWRQILIAWLTRDRARARLYRDRLGKIQYIDDLAHGRASANG